MADDFDEFVAALKSRQASPLDADTTALRTQFAGPTESLGEAAAQDAAGIASLRDPRVLAQHAVPMAIQMLTMGRLGPNARALTKILTSGAGSVLGGAAGEGIGAATEGRAPDLSAGRSLLDFILGAGFEGAVQGGGGVMRRVTGKAPMLRGGADAERQALNDLLETRRNAELGQTEKLGDVARKAEMEALAGQETYDAARSGAMLDQEALLADVAKAAEADALAKRQAAEANVANRRDAVRMQELKHSDAALNSVRDEELERQVKTFLGAPSAIENPTIETLTPRIAPVRESAEKNVRGIFRGISQKFETLLAPYYDLPVEGNYGSVVDSQRALAAEEKKTFSKSFDKLLDEVTGLDSSGGPTRLEALPPALRKAVEGFPPSVRDAVIAGLPAEQRGAAGPTTVRRVDDVRKKLVAVVSGDGTALERRTAGRLIGEIDKSLEPVLPKNMRATWGELRREWRTTNATFSPSFRSVLARADTPEKVADVLYGSAKGKDAHRVLTIWNAMPADEKPMLRSAFAEKLSRGNVVENVRGVDPRVFRQFFGGSGFDTPEAFIEATRTNLVDRLGLQQVMQNPETAARFNQRFQEGLRSFGVRRSEAALAKAEEALRKTPDPGKAIQEALQGELTPPQAADMALRGKTRLSVPQAQQEALAAELTPPQAGDMATAGMERPGEALVRGQMEGMKTPLIGKRMSSYLEHRHSYRVAMALATLGAVHGGFHGGASGWAEILPLAYLGGSRATAAILANPGNAKFWHNALTSKNWEQAGFWLGRLSAASLTEGTRSVTK